MFHYVLYMKTLCFIVRNILFRIGKHFVSR